MFSIPAEKETTHKIDFSKMFASMTQKEIEELAAIRNKNIAANPKRGRCVGDY